MCGCVSDSSWIHVGISNVYTHSECDSVYFDRLSFLEAIKKKIPTLHEDLQYDFQIMIEELEN